MPPERATQECSICVNMFSTRLWLHKLCRQHGPVCGNCYTDSCNGFNLQVQAIENRLDAGAALEVDMDYPRYPRSPDHCPFCWQPLEWPVVLQAMPTRSGPHTRVQWGFKVD